MKQMIKLALVLAAFASVACVLLAFVNNATLPAIQAVKNQELTAGLKEIFADATDFVSPENFTPETPHVCCELSGTVKSLRIT